MKWLIFLLATFMLLSCGTAKRAFQPDKKFSPQQLQADYLLFQKILEERHPSLYWYCTKASMDAAFQTGAQSITDSLTEPAFRKILAQVIAQIQCGHTSVRASKKYAKYTDTVKNKAVFPLYFKTWNDTLVVTHNIFKNDSLLVRGVQVDSIGENPVSGILDSLRGYIAADGGNRIAKDQRLSTGTNLGSMYTWIYGWSKTLKIVYHDQKGRSHQGLIVPYRPPVDSSNKTNKTKAIQKKKQKMPRKERLEDARSLRVDSSGTFAVMELNSFDQGLKLHRFFRRSFRTLHKKKIHHLIIDLRSNGGGRINHSNKFLKYLSTKPFKLADSLYTVTRKSRYSKYISNDWTLKWFLRFFTRKRADGRYHFTWYEKHYFKPRKKSHYSGTTYLLSGGNSFSATSLVIRQLRDQANVTVIGEPTGGAAYGNSALLIPEVTLPHTKVRFRLPLFRLVTDHKIPKDGQGVTPEIEAIPTMDAIRQGIDYKMERAKKEFVRPVSNTL